MPVPAGPFAKTMSFSATARISSACARVFAATGTPNLFRRTGAGENSPRGGTAGDGAPRRRETSLAGYAAWLHGCGYAKVHSCRLNIKTIADPDRARALLAEAGWKPRPDGVLVREGRPFEFTIVTNQGNDQRVKAGEIIQRRLREVGVVTHIRVIEWATFLKEFINPGNFEATLLGWTVPVDPDCYDVWHSSKTAAGQLNFVGFRNEEVDDLLERGRRTLDQAERKQIYDRFQQILAKEQPYLFLYVPDALPVVAARFRGIEPSPSGIMHNFIHWHVPAAEWKYRQ